MGVKFSLRLMLDLVYQQLLRNAACTMSGVIDVYAGNGSTSEDDAQART